jgi:hypothetical protein
MLVGTGTQRDSMHGSLPAGASHERQQPEQ